MGAGSNSNNQKAGGELTFGGDTGGGAINIGGNVGNGKINQQGESTSAGGSGTLGVKFIDLQDLDMIDLSQFHLQELDTDMLEQLYYNPGKSGEFKISAMDRMMD